MSSPLRPSPLSSATRRRIVVAAGTCLAAVSLAACGGNGLQTAASGSGVPKPRPSASPAPRPSSTAATPAPAPSGSTSSASTPTPRPVAPPVCAAGDLQVGLQSPEGGAAAGSVYLLLRFANTSRSTCTMNGHPGVSFVGKHDGTQIGQPAVRTGALRTVTLAPGESTTALLQIANAGNYDAATCAPTTVDGFRVYPPDWRSSVFVAHKTEACQGDTGSSPQMSVSAVGGATDG